MYSYYTGSLLILSGISLYAAIHHIVLNFYRNSDRVHLIFGGMALSLVVATTALVTSFQAGSVAEITESLRWNFIGILVFYLLLPAFTHQLCNIGTHRRSIILGAPLVALFVINLASPYSLQYAEIDGIRTIVLPWQEKISAASGRNSIWFFLASAYIQLLFLYSFVLFIIAYRRSRKRMFLYFAGSLFIFLALSMQSILTRLGIIHFPPLGQFGYLIIQIIMSAALIRETQNGILASEQRFKALIDQAPLSMLLISPQGNITQVNRAFENLWGVSADKILGYNLLQDQQLADYGALPYIKQGLTGVATEIPPVVYNPADNPIVTGPISDRHIRSFVYPIKDKHGQVLEATMIQEDITERIKLQQELAEREHDIRTILDNLPSLIGYWDKNLRNRFANNTYEKWYGIDPASIPGKHIREILGETTYRENLPYIQGALNGEPQIFERIINSPDGKISRHVLAHYIPDKVNDEVRGFFVLVSDVSELKNTENRLAESQAIAHIGSWELLMPDGKVWMSDEAFRIYNIPPDKNLALDFLIDRVHPDDKELVMTQINTALISTSNTALNIEHRILLDNGQVKWINVIAEFTIAPDWSARKASGIIQDITERKIASLEHERLQSQLMQSQKMESIGHLAGGIAHDFNNMLGAILGYAQLLRQVCTGTHPEAQERTPKYINEILTAASRAKELIKQMLVFSRMNINEGNLENPATLIAPVLNEVTSLLRSSIPSSISIQTHIEDSNLKAHIKPVQLHQILLNLVINARDAIGEYGEIEVTVKNFSGQGLCNACNKQFNDQYIQIGVKDTGSGISEQHISKIFDPFFTTKDVGKGTGMGLSVVHGHVHALGGHLTVHSQPGKGTEFNILLPPANNQSNTDSFTESNTDVASQPNLTGIRILVVDDERVVSSMLEDILSHNGALVTVFNSPLPALTAFEQNPKDFDIVVTDETMPELSGSNMAKDMLKSRHDIPVILCTGYSDHVNAQIAKENGIAEFIYKPVDMNLLLSKIQDLCKPGNAY